jgi:hypothetical protein
VAKINFDDLPDEPRAPAGPPSVPISRSNLSDEELKKLAPPTAPISQSNFDPAELRAKGIKFDELPDATAEEKSLARIRQIASTMKAGEPWHPGPLDIIADAGAMSVTRPITALAGAISGGLLNSYPGSTLDERYKAATQFLNDRNARGDEATGPIAPLVRTAAQLPLSMASGGGAASRVFGGAGPTTAATRTVGGIATNPVTAAVRTSIPASVLETGARAAVPGFIEGASQNAGSVSDAIAGGTTNALLSGATASTLAGASKMMPSARSGAAAEATAMRGKPADEIAKEAKAHYKVLDNNGIAYDASQTSDLYTGLHKLRNDSVYVPGTHAGLDHLYDDLMTRSRGPMTFNELDNARSAISKVARHPDESTRVGAGAMLGEIDKLVHAGAPTINPNNVNVPEAYSKARGLWRQKALIDDTEFHAGNVERKEAINPSTDPNKATKAEFGAVEKRISRPGAYDPYSQDQRDLLSRIVRGDPMQNRLASVGDAFRGRYAPWAAGSAAISVPTMLGISKSVDPLLAYSLGGAAGAVAAGGVNRLGKALQASAASRGQENVNALLRSVSGSPLPTPGAAVDRGDLAKILFAQDLSRLAPRAGSQLIGDRKDKEL